jgi:hypothetical protein
VSALFARIHPKAQGEIRGLATSSDPRKKDAAAFIVALIELLKSCPAVRACMFDVVASIDIPSQNGKIERVDIKMIKQLKDIADDQRYHQDAIRRIRDLEHSAAADYRLFYAPRKLVTNGNFYLHVLGLFDRDNAYTQSTLTELTYRYRNP